MLRDLQRDDLNQNGDVQEVETGISTHGSLDSRHGEGPRGRRNIVDENLPVRFQGGKTNEE